LSPECAATREAFVATCEREGFSSLVVSREQAGEVMIRQASRAHLLVAPVTGESMDSVVHFVCGAIVAKPRVGYGSPLLRRILLLAPNGSVAGLVADSLLRCVETVVAPQPSHVQSEVVNAAIAYRKWMQAKPEVRTK